MIKLLPLIAVAITVTGWFQVTGGYTLELDTTMENQLKNLTCVSYCDHCGCTGEFINRNDTCTCDCPEGAGDADCIAEVLETKNLIGLNYTLELKNASQNKSNVQHTRIRRQVMGRARDRRQQRPPYRSGGRRYRSTLTPRDRRPFRRGRNRSTEQPIIVVET